MEDLLLEVLSDKGYGGAMGTQEWAAQPCFIQSFEVCDSFQLRIHACSPSRGIGHEKSCFFPNSTPYV
jgi:hypothetical protein